MRAAEKGADAQIGKGAVLAVPAVLQYFQGGDPILGLRMAHQPCWNGPVVALGQGFELFEQ